MPAPRTVPASGPPRARSTTSPAPGQPARRYAAAALQVAVEDSKLDEWSAGVDELATLFSNPQANRYFADGKVPEADKFKVLEEVLAGAEPRVVNLGRLLIRKGLIQV